MNSERGYVPCFIALGGNLGNRTENLRWAARMLMQHAHIKQLESSPVYESAAHTKKTTEQQPAYLNAVLKLETTLDPLDLLTICLDLERERGRVRQDDHGWEPRTLDLDLLTYGTMSRISDRLTVPHPRLFERRFVLKPWHDLAPSFWVPAPFEKKVSALLEACPDSTKLVRTADSLLD